MALRFLSKTYPLSTIVLVDSRRSMSLTSCAGGHGLVCSVCGSNVYLIETLIIKVVLTATDRAPAGTIPEFGPTLV